MTALKLRAEQQQRDRDRAVGAWMDTGLVFTTRHGTAIEPRGTSARDALRRLSQWPGS